MSQWNVHWCTYVWHGMAWHGETQLKYAITYFAIHFLFIFHNLFSVHIPVVSSFSVYSPLSSFFFQILLLFSPLFVLFVVYFWHVCFLLFDARKLHQWLQCWIYGCLYVCVCVFLSLSESLSQCVSWSWWWLVFDTDHIISSNMYFVYSMYLKYHKSKGMTQSFFVPRKSSGKWGHKTPKKIRKMRKINTLLESNRILWRHAMSISISISISHFVCGMPSKWKWQNFNAHTTANTHNQNQNPIFLILLIVFLSLEYFLVVVFFLLLLGPARKIEPMDKDKT